MDLLIELTSLGTAGLVASLGFDYLRERVKPESSIGAILHTPQFARWITLSMAAGLATLAAYGAELLGGPIAQPAISAAWAAVTSQAIHAIRHLAIVPTLAEGE